MENVVIQKFEKRINSSLVKAIAQVLDNKIWIHINGETIVFEKDSRASGRRGKRVSKETKSNLIFAPMPGKITKLFKKEGDAVIMGESVLVMEAMKMEYTLKANVTGTIKKVAFNELEQVVLGALIIEIDPKKES